MIRTFIVDDQNLIREGIRMLLEKAVKIEIVGDANNGETALKRIEATRPDVVLLDIDMPGIDGFTVAGKMRSRFPQIKIIMLSSHENKDYVEKSIALGAKGYLLKDATGEELERSIELVHQGYSTIKSDLLGESTVKAGRFELHSEGASQTTSPAENGRVSLTVDSPNSANSPQSLSSPSSVASKTKSKDLELLLAKNQVRQKYASFRQQRQKTQIFHSASLTQFKRTVSSFEFRLLVLIILFSLGFLTFVALS